MSYRDSGLLQGRTVLILGIDDIGKGMARRFALEGAALAVADPGDAARGIALASEFGCVAGSLATGTRRTNTVGHVVAELAAALGGLDSLVCNLLPPSHACDLEDLLPHALSNALGSLGDTFEAMRAALPWLTQSGRGRVVLIGQRYGESVSESLGAYNAAAWGLVGLARTAAIEWGPHGIATNVLVPLARTAEFEAARVQRPAIIDRLVEQLPLRRIGDPVDDVGAAAALLASDTMGWVNGEVIHADGGQHTAGPVLNPARFAPT